MSSGGLSKELIADALRRYVGKVESGSVAVLLVDGANQSMVSRGSTLLGVDPARQYYQCGSITKYFTSVACLALHQQGEFGLDQPLRHVADLVPRYAGARVRLTPREICHHFTGLNVRMFPGYLRAEPIPSLREIVAGGGHSPALAFTGVPQAKTVYSSGGFLLLQTELEQHLGGSISDVISAAVKVLAADVAVIFDASANTDTVPFARGFVKPTLPVPDGSLHYPESCSQGLWARPQDLASLLVAVAACVRNPRSADGRGRDVATDLLERRHHRRMAMSVLVETDAEGRQYYHAQGENAGFTSEFVSYPVADVHVVAMASAAVTAPELHAVVKAALSTADGLHTSEHRPKVTAGAFGTYTGESLRVEVDPPGAVLRTGGEFEIGLVERSDGTYGVPGASFPRLTVGGERACLLDESRVYELVRSPVAGAVFEGEPEPQRGEDDGF